VEPALGEKREEMLRMAGIKTFFIVRALKPVSTALNSIQGKLHLKLFLYVTPCIINLRKKFEVRPSVINYSKLCLLKKNS
jgi:hypothetical protein